MDDGGQKITDLRKDIFELPSYVKEALDLLLLHCWAIVATWSSLKEKCWKIKAPVIKVRQKCHKKLNKESLVLTTAETQVAYHVTNGDLY